MNDLRARAIRIHYSSGEDGWTSRLRALKGIKSGRYTYVDENTVAANEAHPGHQACLASIAEGGSVARKPMAAAPAQSPTIQAAVMGTAGCQLRTFARYPVDPKNFGRTG